MVITTMKVFRYLLLRGPLFWRLVFFLLVTVTSFSFQDSQGIGQSEDDKNKNLIYNDGDVADVSDVEGNYDLVEEEDVLILTRLNFNHVINTRQFVLVEFYAPWCAHCKELAPDYSVAAKILKETNNLTLGKVDVSKEESLSKEFQIEGFPTIFLFEHGVKSEEYNGERTADGIITYMEARTDPNWKPPPTHVIELTDANFSKYVTKKPLALVLFYAEYCQHCLKIKPEYINAAKTLIQYDIPLIQIDGMKNKEIADEYKVRGWPTLYVFRNGRAFEYKGSREVKGIVSYMKEQLLSPTRECKNYQEVENRIDRYLPTIIGIFTSANSAFFREFFVVANYLRGEPLRFVHTFSQEVGNKLGVTDEGVIVKKPTVFVSDYEQKEYKLIDVTKTGDEIAEFIRLTYRPLVGQRTKQNQVLFYSVRPIVVVYYDANFEYQFEKASERIRIKVVEVAKDFPKITFTVANEDEFPEELEAVKLGESGVDVNVIWYDKNRVKYTMDPVDDFDGSDLRSFVNQVQDGKLKPVWKSQPIPTRQAGSVFITVADNYEESIFKKKNKDVVFYIYAPWCGHCKEFEKTYKKLAKKLSSDHLLFAKMDGTANDLPPGLEVKGYPTIFYLKDQQKHEPILYEGDRSYVHFESFLKQHYTNLDIIPDASLDGGSEKTDNEEEDKEVKVDAANKNEKLHKIEDEL